MHLQCPIATALDGPHCKSMVGDSKLSCCSHSAAAAVMSLLLQYASLPATAARVFAAYPMGVAWGDTSAQQPPASGCAAACGLSNCLYPMYSFCRPSSQTITVARSAGLADVSLLQHKQVLIYSLRAIWWCVNSTSVSSGCSTAYSTTAGCERPNRTMLCC